MDLRGMLNDDDGQSPLTIKTSRIASVASMLSPTTPATVCSPTAAPVSGSIPNMRPPREIPPWAQRFDWNALQRGEAPHTQLPGRPAQQQQQQHKQQQQQQQEQAQLASQQPSSPPSHATNIFEPSITNIEPYDEIVRQVCDFLWENVIAHNNLHCGASNGTQSAIKFEIEGKLGTLMLADNPGSRLPIPISSQAISAYGPNRLRFESRMDEHQHKTLNDFLNMTVGESLRSNRPSIHYQHVRETDQFYKADESVLQSLPPVVHPFLRNGPGKPRIRVTRDTNTKEVKAQIIKLRVRDLDIISPSEAFDCRISVNIEIQVDEDISTLEAFDEPGRVKDRLSYRHMNTRIDLTQVKKERSPHDKFHELEVELMAEPLIEQGIRMQNSCPDACYEDLVKTFVNNIRILSREATTSASRLNHS